MGMRPIVLRTCVSPLQGSIVEFVVYLGAHTPSYGVTLFQSFCKEMPALPPQQPTSCLSGTPVAGMTAFPGDSSLRWNDGLSGRFQLGQPEKLRVASIYIEESFLEVVDCEWEPWQTGARYSPEDTDQPQFACAMFHILTASYFRPCRCQERP